MKGKNIFTNSEIREIKRLINIKVISSTNKQKGIRAKIRKIGFYFSNYSSKKGYTLADLEKLILLKKIKIIS